MAENFVISEGEVIEALTSYVAENCCYRSGIIEDISIRRIEMRSAYIYTLETMTEKRETKLIKKVYQGEPIDEQQTEGPVDIWRIEITPPEEFNDSTKTIVVPQSERVRTCLVCGGNDFIICTQCGGSGGINYTETIRKGSTSRNRLDCTRCKGSKRIKCNNCSGKSRHKQYLELRVTWTCNIKYSTINEIDGFPNKYVKKAAGHFIFSQVGQNIDPITDVDNDSVKTASLSLINSCKTEFDGLIARSKVILQRQEVKLVRVAVVHYDYKNTTGHFYVFDTSHTVYFPNYPGNCSMCCSIM